jgi:hypothetical protein
MTRLRLSNIIDHDNKLVAAIAWTVTTIIIMSPIAKQTRKEVTPRASLSWLLATPSLSV